MEYFLMVLMLMLGFIISELRHSFDCLVFRTSNKGRTWKWQGAELRASPLTDQLQNTYTKIVLGKWSQVNPKHGDFYDD